MELKETNRLIAEFEGRLFHGHPISGFGDGTGNSLPEMKYHERWDWIMPVLQKLSIDHTLSCFSLPIQDDDGKWMFMVRFDGREIFSDYDLLSATYKAVADQIVSLKPTTP